MTRPRDWRARIAALNPKKSFIVQAPAGSGKTTLLTQRTLRLLSLVDEPEEIVAITFTRKAATEMRHRIVEALILGQQTAAPQEEHERLTWHLAKKALERNAERGWCLLQHPSRLRIMTIDAFCSYLIRQMPWLSRFGAPGTVADDREALYRQAARRTIDLMEQQDEAGQAVCTLVSHLDNRLDKVEDMLVRMLAKRDQWLRHLAGGQARDMRKVLEGGLERLSQRVLQDLTRLVPAHLQADLLDLARLAANNLLQENSGSPICACAGLAALPGPTEADREAWLGIAELLLTDNGSWRKRITKDQGFPSETRDKVQKQIWKADKERTCGLLELLDGEDALLSALQELRKLPATSYSTEQWHVLAALITVLPRAVGHLWMTFQEQGEVDFVEVAQKAVFALGDEDNYTDLAQRLDYQIRHILVDEFQDTSFSQYQLLDRLTANWSQSPGNTLFFVGDPQQSIYRFREADVGLYLKVRQHGIGSMVLERLSLTVNFRSDEGIVDWVNTAFAQAFPSVENILQGAVPYTPSTASRPAASQPAVTVHPQIGNDDAAEARAVVAGVSRTLADCPQDNVAILVKARSHLPAILHELATRGIHIQAVEIASLKASPVILDLLSLTRSLYHLADRMSWIALLRGPCCGLTLADLAQLCQDESRTVWECLGDGDLLAQLADGARLIRFRKIMSRALQQRRVAPVRRLVEGTWIALGGPACIGATDLEDARIFLNLLDEMDTGCNTPELVKLEEALDGLYATPDAGADGRVQVMTVHKAKGLEFDHVFLPGLHRSPRRKDQDLLLWMEHTGPQGRRDLLLAPVKPTHAEADSLYDYIQQQEAKRELHEMGRLLYVAATRARKRLHLFGSVTLNNEGEVQRPGDRTFLGRIWETVLPSYEAAAQAVQTVPAATPADSSGYVAPTVERLPQGWHLPLVLGEDLEAAVLGEVAPPPEQTYKYQSGRGALIDRVARDLLYRITVHPPCDRATLHHLACALLRQHGMLAGDAGAADLILKAIDGMMQSVTGRMILKPGPEAGSRQRICGVLRSRLIDVVVERMVRDEKGRRLLLGYRVGDPLDPADLPDLVEECARLEAAGRLLQQVDGIPFTVGIYLPVQDRLYIPPSTAGEGASQPVLRVPAAS